MRTLNSNKQKMFYSLQVGEIPIYEMNPDGSIKYIEVDGEMIPVDTGEMELGYSEPVGFEANISNKLNEVVWESFGIDNSANYAQIIAEKDKLQLKSGSVIWKKSEIGYKDTGKTIVDSDTSDYIVKGVADEGKTEDLFLLQRKIK